MSLPDGKTKLGWLRAQKNSMRSDRGKLHDSWSSLILASKGHTLPISLILKGDTSVGIIQLSAIGSGYYTPQQGSFSSCRKIGFHYNPQLSARTQLRAELSYCPQLQKNWIQRLFVPFEDIMTIHRLSWSGINVLSRLMGA